MATSASSSLTTTQRCPSSARYLHPNAMPPRQYPPMKELFAEHGIPESLCSDNGPQFASTLFAEFATDWNFDHCTSAPTNPYSNGQAETAVKIVKGLLIQSKYLGQDPYLGLLAYHSTPVDAHLCSPGETLYQCALCTTVPQNICHTDQHYCQL